MSEQQTSSEAMPDGVPSVLDTKFRFAPRLRRLAKISYRLACAGPFAFWVMALLYPQTNERALPALPIQALYWALCLSAPLGAALGAIALLLFRRQSLGHRKLNVSYAHAGLIVGVLASLSLLVGIPSLNGHRLENHYGNGGRRIGCLSNIKQLGLGFAMYVQDYDEHYPLPKAWNESIFPYTKNTAILHCPYAPEESLPTYAMNRRLKSVLSARIETPANTVMLFDSIPGKNLSGGREVLPDPPRHRNGDNNIGFVDGHAKSVSQKNLSFLLWTPHLTTIPYAPDMPMDKTFSSQAPTGK